MGIFCFLASALSLVSSVSVNITATRFLREWGEGPEPEPLGRPAPGRLPPQVDFWLTFRFGVRADLADRFAFVVRLDAIFFPRVGLCGYVGGWTPPANGAQPEFGRLPRGLSQ
jgi:hypothetical protein